MFNDLYKYKEFLGKGGFGYVVQAVHRRSGTDVALKIVETSSSNAVKCVRREANVLREMPKCPHVVGYVGFEEY